MLLFSFFAQPINQAYAQSEEEEKPVAADVASQDASQSEQASDSTENPAEDSLDLSNSIDLEATNNTNADTTETEEDETDTGTTTEEVAEVPPTPDLFDDEEVDIKSLEEIQQEVEQELEEKEDNVREVEFLVNDDNFYQFNRRSCVAIGDGSYHCTTTEAPEIDSSAVVFSDKGENGAKQIFLRTSKGGLKQITDDRFDNTSPDYDAESMQIVWQRMIDGRYQIMVYDINAAEERQLTFSRTNNMEPKVASDGIVWQAWDGNDWEVMFFDGTYTDQLTDNEIQDVTPVVKDRYVLWSVLGGKEQEARVYSLDSKELLTISGQDGGKIANPRFVLVYDTKFENGDIITQGFDPATGISSSLGVTPKPEPIKIPDVDPLGEIRALINNKAQQEDDMDSALHPDNASSTDTLHIEKATSTDTLNLKIDQGDSLDMQIAPTDDDEIEFELTEYDLVLVPADLQGDKPEKEGTLKLDSTQ